MREGTGIAEDFYGLRVRRELKAIEWWDAGCEGVGQVHSLGG